MYEVSPFVIFDLEHILSPSDMSLEFFVSPD